MKVLIAGGAGYIGSTIASACLDANITPVILDNLSTGRRAFTEGRIFYEGDIGDAAMLDRIFSDHPDISAAVLCAALIVVPDSTAFPIEYYEVNVSAALRFCQSLLNHGCPRLLFSSSASIYASGDAGEVDESTPFDPLSPYARTKVVCEWMFEDLAKATDLSVLSLRYFNPIGADPQLRSGLQLARPSHALGQLILAQQEGRPFTITGTDYPTRDGTGIRDYIHVWDLADAHIRALQRFDQVISMDAPFRAVNLGTGRGTTVRELVTAFNEVSPNPVDSVDGPRRDGDAAGGFASNALAASLLGWTPQRSIADGIADSLRWSEVRRDRLYEE
jgi:UDP-glucose 4-epimerase